MRKRDFLLPNGSYFPVVSGAATNLNELALKERHLIAKGASPGYIDILGCEV